MGLSGNGMPIRSCVSGPTHRYASTVSGDRDRTFRSSQGRHARTASRDCCAIRIGSFVPFAHTSESGSYRLSLLFARRFHLAQETRLIPCVHSQTRTLLVPGRTVRTSFGPGPILSFSRSVLSPDSFAKRRSLRDPAAALARRLTAGPAVRPHGYLSPCLPLARGILANPYPELLFGWSVARVHLPLPMAEDPRKPVASLGLKQDTGPCARLYGRAVRFDHNRNNGKRLFGCSARATSEILTLRSL